MTYYYFNVMFIMINIMFDKIATTMFLNCATSYQH